MSIDADVHKPAQDDDAELPRKAWVKPEILLQAPLIDAEGAGSSAGDGITNMS